MIEEPLLSRKQLADRLGRHPTYVKAMVRRGFKMVAGRTTLTAAIRWLSISDNSKPRAGEKKNDHD